MSQAELELKEAPGDTTASSPGHGTSSPGPAASSPGPAADPDPQEEKEETEPMTGAALEPGPAEEPEKNGSVKLKIPEEKEEEEAEEVAHFTGLNKEELLRVAGTPGWVRTRWALLVLFWLCWLGMLAGAVLIILGAPVCREMPVLRWWNQGPLYRVRSLEDFSPTQDIRGVEQQLDRLQQLKVKGLVLGPVHVAPKGQPEELTFEEVSPETGSMEQVKSLLHTAHKRGLFVVLDLTPNYHSLTSPWFSNVSAEVSEVTERLKSALVLWLTVGVDGVLVGGVDTVSTLVPSEWNDIRAIVQNWTDSRPHKRLLMGETRVSSPYDVSVLLNDSGVDLLLSPVLSQSESDATERAQTVQLLYSAHNQTSLLWSLGPSPFSSSPSPFSSSASSAPSSSLSASPTAVPPPSTRGSGEVCAGGKDLMLLLTLPGTALIHSGAELGLREGEKLWESEQNNTQQQPLPSPCSLLLSSLSSLRSKERSLLVGDYTTLYNSSSVLVYKRSWDQSPAFITAINYSEDQEFNAQVLEGLRGARLKVVLSTNTTALSPDLDLDLDQILLPPSQAAVFREERV